MPKKVELSSDTFERARRLRMSGMSWAEIAEMMGTSNYILQRALDPNYRERCKLKSREQKRHRLGVKKPRDEMRDKVVQLRPRPEPDNRDLTARFFGDPPAGRREMLAAIAIEEDKRMDAYNVRQNGFSRVNRTASLTISARRS